MPAIAARSELALDLSLIPQFIQTSIKQPILCGDERLVPTIIAGLSPPTEYPASRRMGNGPTLYELYTHLSGRRKNVFAHPALRFDS